MSCIGKSRPWPQNDHFWKYIFRNASTLKSDMEKKGLSQIVLVGADLECLHARRDGEICPFHGDRRLNLLIYFNITKELKEVTCKPRYDYMMGLFRDWEVRDDTKRTILLTDHNIALHFECPTIPDLLKIGGRRDCYAVSFGDEQEHNLQKIDINYTLETCQKQDNTDIYTYGFRLLGAAFCMAECRFHTMPPDHGSGKNRRLDNLVKEVYEKLLDKNPHRPTYWVS